MGNRDFKNKDLGDGFEPTWRDDEPTFSFDWPEAIALGGLTLFALGIALTIQ